MKCADVGFVWGVNGVSYVRGGISSARDISGYLCLVEFDGMLGIFLYILGMACMGTMEEGCTLVRGEKSAVKTKDAVIRLMKES